MKKLINYQNTLLAALFLIYLTIGFSCKKYEVKELGPEPVASFTVAPISGMVNTYLLTSTSTNGFRYDWDKGTGDYVEGQQTDTAYFADKGDYIVNLLVYGQSGTDIATSTISVTEDDPAALTPLKMLTGNSSRTWILAPEAGALWVGPSDYSATWWANSEGDLAVRSCLFNDEFTFTLEGSVLTFVSQGDFYVDEDNGTTWPAGMPTTIGCTDNSNVPVEFQAWSNDATFTFNLTATNQLELIGTGAHLGLYKVATPPMALASEPQPGITYDIVSITPEKLVVKLVYDFGTWQFTYVSL